MKRKQHIIPSEHYTNLIPALLFLATVIINIFTTHYVSSHYIDADTSSELILAQHWIDAKTPLSPDWIYGSELRLFHSQLVYVPLMLLLDNWQTVRFIGILIMQALYILSFGCLVRASGQSRNFFFYGAAMLLLPISVVYGRIVLYHNHYLPNITISFFLIALSMGFVDKVDWRNWKTWLRLTLLAILSFAGGLNSIRQLLITHTPLVLTLVALCWVEDTKNHDKTKSAFLKPANLRFLFCNVFSAGFSLLGLKANHFLCDRFGLHIFVQSDNKALSLMDAQYINDMLYGFFHQFGFREGVSMLSVNGILTLGSIFTGCYLIFISVKRLLRSHSAQNKRKTILSLFFLAHIIVLISVFLVTTGSSAPYHYPLYLSLCFSWAVPLILTHLEELPSAIHPLQAKRLFASVSVLLLLLSGTVNILYFQGSERFPQVYEGLLFQNRNKKAELTEAVAYLTQHGYDKGYADHWDSGVIVEMTNGNMPMVTIDYSRDFTGSNIVGNIEYQHTLISLWLRESPCKKPFLILTAADAESLAVSNTLKYCTEVYAGQHHVIYDINNLDAFMDTLRY